MDLRRRAPLAALCLALGCGGDGDGADSAGTAASAADTGTDDAASTADPDTDGPGESGPATDSDPDPDTGDTDPTGEPMCEVTQFGADPTAWSLPALAFPIADAQPLSSLAGAYACTNERSFRHSLMDLTADGVADLVVTDACDAGDVGVEFWLVYPGGTDGFGDEPSLWTLPDHGFDVADPEPLSNTVSALGCDNDESFRHTTLDLTNDGVLDLVVTDACDASGVGVAMWLVYAGGSDGFAAEPAPWHLPPVDFPVLEPEPLESLSGAFACDGDRSFRHTTLDVTQDGYLDLVVTDACDAGDVGVDLWLVYEGGPNGFADEARPWSLPVIDLPIAEPQPLANLASGLGCTNERSFRHTTLDLTRDGYPDLVVTDACDDGDVGVDLWLVYQGGPNGFAADPSPWSLPALPFGVLEPQPLASLGGAFGCENERSFRHVVLDVTGDGVVDLLVTDACDADGVGVEVWLVYKGGEGGFADDATTWSLPAHGFPVIEPEPLASTAGAFGCDNDQSFRHTTMDLDGDGQLDLVLTDACDSADVGVDLWLMYPGQCG